MIKNSKPIGLPKYKVGDIHHQIGCSDSGPHISPHMIEGVLWKDNAWVYLYYTDLTTYMDKDCGEAACDDPFCDRIVITNWVHETQVHSSRILAEMAAYAFWDKSLMRRDLFNKAYRQEVSQVKMYIEYWLCVEHMKELINEYNLSHQYFLVKPRPEFCSVGGCSAPAVTKNIHRLESKELRF